MDILTHRMERGSRIIYNTKVDIFPKIGPKEMYQSSCYDGIKLKLVSYMPYRKSEEILNRIRWQDDEEIIKYRTIGDAVAREGAEIIDYIDTKARQILVQNHFNVNSGNPDQGYAVGKDTECPEIHMIPKYQVKQAIDEYNNGKAKELQIDEAQINEVFEDLTHSVNISVDDVGVTEQKESNRSKDSQPSESKHYVKNTVIHIQQGINKYILDGLGMKGMLIILTAFLLNNNLLTNNTIVFFADGADNIKNGIKDIFGWRPYRIILDWYHLRKKCKERLSMAMNGRVVRNMVLKKLISLLWLGKVDAAEEYLRGLDGNMVRNISEIELLIAYFERNRNNIPCYELRKKLGLRVSSNRGEKANDLVVAQRQKHNGMSWSKAGSSGLANIRVLFLNKEDENWITRRKLEFKLVSETDKKVA